MKRLALSLAFLFAAGMAHATGSHTPDPKPTPAPSSPQPIDVTSTAAAGAAAQAGAVSGSRSVSNADLSATLTGSASATGGNVGPQSFEQFSRSNMYVLPAPVSAAPLPAGLCPQGDSMSVGILWNLFSYSRSSTRSEMECLDRVLAAVRTVPRVEVIQAPVLPPAPAVAPAPTPAPQPAKPKGKPVHKQAAACVSSAPVCPVKR